MMAAGGFLLFGISLKGFAEGLAEPLQGRDPTLRKEG
jgi:hypothetical protein